MRRHQAFALAPERVDVATGVRCCFLPTRLVEVLEGAQGVAHLGLRVAAQVEIESKV